MNKFTKILSNFVEKIRVGIAKAGLQIESFFESGEWLSSDSLQIAASGSNTSLVSLGSLEIDETGDSASETVIRRKGEPKSTISAGSIRRNDGRERSNDKNIASFPSNGLENIDQNAFDQNGSDGFSGHLANNNRAITRSDLPRRVAGGRISIETPNAMAGGMEIFTAFSTNQYWQTESLRGNFNTDRFSRIKMDDLAELLTELSPEVSAALWYFLLCCNSGFECNAYKPGTKDIDEKAQELINADLKLLGSYHGTINTFFDKTFMCIFMRGSFLYELIFDDNGRDFVDMASPDTRTLRYKRVLNPKRGQVWDVGQFQNGTFVSLNIPTVRYVPLHPLPGRMEGRPMISPSFFVTIFLMSVLRDLKRVIQQQGYMRLDLEVIFEKLKDAMPKGADDDPELFKDWADSVVAEVEAFYADLEPDDAYVHSDAIKINNPAGTANANSLTAMDALFSALERMAVRALKTLPEFLGLNSSRDSGDANRRFEFYQKGNETVQRMPETAFSELMELRLQARGIIADVRLKFAQMRASEELRDTQLLMLKAKLGRYYYDCGYFSQDESAKFATGKDKADESQPRTSADTNDGGIASLNPDTSVNRTGKKMNFAEMSAFLRSPNNQDILAAMQIWNEFASDDAKDLINPLPMPENTE